MLWLSVLRSIRPPSRAHGSASPTSFRSSTWQEGLARWSCYQGVPTTSTVNWYTSPTTRANGSIIPTDAGENRSYVGGSFSTHYLFDLAGYFR